MLPMNKDKLKKLEEIQRKDKKLQENIAYVLKLMKETPFVFSYE